MSGNVLKTIGAMFVVGLPILIKGCDTSALRTLREVAPTVAHVAPANELAAAKNLAREAAEATDAAAAGASHAADSAIPRTGMGMHTATGADVEHNRPPELSTSLTTRAPLHTPLAGLHSSWKTLPGETIEQIQFSSGVKLGRVKEPLLIAAFPTDESQFSKVYLKTPSASSTKEMKSLAAKLPTAAGSWDWTKFSGSSTFPQELKGLKTYDLIGIIAHSEDEGRTLVLPNGTRIDFMKLHESCSNEGKVCVVLSCFSDDLKIQTEITTSDALAMWNSAIEKWKKEPTWGSEEFILEIRKSRIKMVNRRKIYLTTVVGTGLFGGSYQLMSSRQR